MNWGALSEDMSIGMPKRAIQWKTRACTQLVAFGRGLGTRLGSGCVVERDGLWPARESIYHCEEVGETVGRWQCPTRST